MNTFKKEVIKKNIIHLIFKSQKDLCQSMIRLEEFYESPEFANKKFTLNEYKPWYVKNYGQWSYYSDWSGFNIPGHKIHEFLKTNQKLRMVEKYIFQTLPKDKFYLIATYEGGRSDILDHEIAHAMFYLNHDYKQEMTSLVNANFNNCTDLSDWILKSYNTDVLIDELQAYLSTSDLKWFNSKNINFHNEELLNKFANIYKKYLK